MKKTTLTLWIFTAVIVVGVLLSVLWMSYRGMAADGQTVAGGPLPVLFDAPVFSLTNQDGQAFGSEQLRGKVWIADFVFTRCAGVCPAMSRHMARLQQLTAGSEVRLISFSVDPRHDTPAVLKQYATDYKADPSRWFFLTGTQEQTWEVAKGMKLHVGPDKDEQVSHSSNFLLIDGQGQVRGIYSGDKDQSLQELADDARSLANQLRH